MHCGSSLLAGLSATYALNFRFNQTAPSQPQLASAGLIVMALAFLSPLHHFQRVLRSVRSSLNGAYEMLFSFVTGFEKPDPVYLEQPAGDPGI